MKKFLVFGAVMALGVLTYLDLKEQREEEARHHKPRGFEVRRHAAVGSWQIPGRQAHPTAAAPTVDSPLEVADRYLDENRERLGLKAFHELRPSVFQTPLGAQVTYQVFQDGLPVLGSELRVRIGQDRSVASLENQYLPVERVRLEESEAMDTSQLWDLMKVSNYQPDASVGTEPAKVIFPVPGTNRAELALVVSVRDPGNRRPVQLLLRASDGQLLAKNYSRVEFRR